jgi:hypothetical protein
MHRLLAFVALVLLIASAPIGDASADTRTGHKSTSKAIAVHSLSGHGTSPRYHALGAGDGKGAYYSQLKRDKSEWRQARRRGSMPASVAWATNREG